MYEGKKDMNFSSEKDISRHVAVVRTMSKKRPVGAWNDEIFREVG